MNRDFCILLAEDDENDVFFMRRAFKEAGIKNPLQVATNGQEAIKYLSEIGPAPYSDSQSLPGLILMDLKMPLKGGLEVLEWIRQQPHVRCIPVIILSSSEQRSDINKAFHLGANSFVTKPTSLEDRNEFARLIRDFWLRYNHSPFDCGES